jgi:hypothetical protein
MLSLTTSLETRHLRNVSQHYDVVHEAPVLMVPIASLRLPSEPDKLLLITYGAEADVAAFTVCIQLPVVHRLVVPACW